VNRAPLILASVYVTTLLTALPFATVMYGALRTHLGSSTAAEQAVRGVNLQWWSEFTAQAGALGKTFEPAIIGFAAVLDNLSALADGEARPSPLLWLGVFYLLLWLFLAGGILDRYARSRQTHAHEFLSACAVYFVRFLRLAPLIFGAYYVLFAVLHPFIFLDLYEELTLNIADERSAFLIRLALYAVFGLVLVAVNIVFDYAKVRAVVEDRRSMAGAVIAGFRFMKRNLGSVSALYGMSAVMFVGLLMLYAMVAPGAVSRGAGIWLAFVVGQLYMLGRLWVRLVFFASETALFQGRLAHAGYVANAPLQRREPPVVEQFVRGS
jgi:hypothetical protein